MTLTLNVHRKRPTLLLNRMLYQLNNHYWQLRRRNDLELLQMLMVLLEGLGSVRERKCHLQCRQQV